MDTQYTSPIKGWMVLNDELDTSSPAIMALLVAPLIFVLWAVANPGGQDVLGWFANGFISLTSIVAAIACLVAARRYGDSATGRAWALIFIGMVAMSFGQVAWLVQEQAMGQTVSSPAVADIGYLAFYPFVFAGLFMMPHAPSTASRRITLGLDIAIITAAITLIAAHFVLAEVRPDESTTSTVSLIYPVCDLAIILATLALVMRAGPSISRLTMIVLALGFIAIAISDSFYVYLMEKSEYSTGNLLDTGWVFGYALIGAAALTAAGRPLNIDAMKDEESRTSPIWQTVFLHLMVAPVLLILFLNRDGSDLIVSIMFMAGFIVMTLLLFMRQFSAHMEHSLALHQLEDANDSLRRALQAERMRRLGGFEIDTGDESETPSPPSV